MIARLTGWMSSALDSVVAAFVAVWAWFVGLLADAAQAIYDLVRDALPDGLTDVLGADPLAPFRGVWGFFDWLLWASDTVAALVFTLTIVAGVRVVGFVHKLIPGVG